MGQGLLAQKRFAPVHSGLCHLPQTGPTIVDAYTVMKKNGPRGVSMEDLGP